MKIFWIQMFITILLICKYSCMEIINGDEAKPHSRPYMALIRTTIQSRHTKTCGGALIGASWILTAAHCFINSVTTVELGVHAISHNDQQRQKFEVLKSIRHPLYDPSNNVNDLQILQLSGNVQTTEAVNILPLPQLFDDIDANTICETAGWGRTNNNQSSISDVLMEAKLKIIDRRSCRVKWLTELNITEDMICSEIGRQGVSTCHGDSGGPLVCNGIFRGVISFGSSVCGIPEETTVYTRLTHYYVQWIKEETNTEL